MERDYAGELRAGIHRTLDDTKQREITQGTIEGYGSQQWDVIMACLLTWEAKGYVKVLKDPREASPDEVCITMNAYIDQKSPWSDWL